MTMALNVLKLSKILVNLFGESSMIIANCDIDFFVFRHQFQIMSPNFPKFERVQNSVVKF